ncbi:MAG: CehA/McbA family metallohydrolase [Myxococcota bacterium]
MTWRAGALACALCVGAALTAACGGEATQAADASSPDADAVDGAVDSSGGDSLPDALTCAPPAPAAGAVRARALACADDLPQGPHIAAVPGDLVLENARARFVVRAQREGYALLGLPGGHLVDAVRLAGGAQAGDDALRELAVTVDFWVLAPDSVAVVEDGSDGTARVRVEGRLAAFPLVQSVLPLPEPDVHVVHEYVLRPDSPVLEILTLLTPRDPGPGPGVILADVSLWGAGVRLYIPSLGADELPTSVSGAVLGLAPSRADATTPAYAIATDAARTLVDASGIKAFLFPDTPVLADGTTAIRRFAVGGFDGADLASAMAAVSGEGEPADIRARGEVTGAFSGVEVEALDPSGAPLTLCAVTDGRFDCPLPAGATQLVATWRGDGNGDVSLPAQWAGEPVAIAQSGETVLTANPARVEVSARDPDGAPVPFRLDAWSTTADDERTFVDADGDATFLLPPGTWEIFVHHGPRWSRHTETLTLAPGQTQQVSAALRKVVEAPGWVAIDTHVHAEDSTDSEAAHAHRFAAALAEDLVAYVATDHDFVTDPAPWLAAAGLSERLSVAPGVEVSTTSLGHFNVWPVVRDTTRAGQGAPDWDGLDAPALLARLRAAVGKGPGQGIIQLNHPRFGGAAYFNAIGFDAATVDPALLDFDAMELVNGIGHSDTPKVLEDWFSLLNRGIRITGTGASDVHGAGEPMGLPGTLVRPGPDADLWEALRQGRAVVSAGPWLTLEIADEDGRVAAIGDTLSQPEGQPTLTAVLEAPDWLPLGRLQLYVSGVRLLDEDVSQVPAVDGRRRVLRTLSLPAKTDAWCVAVHVPGATPRPGLRRPPWAITNPAFIDGDGDGRSAPGPP